MVIPIDAHLQRALLPKGVSKCTEVCTEVYRDVCRVYPGVPRCSKVCTEVYQGCTEGYRGVRGVPRFTQCTEVYRGVPRCTEVRGDGDGGGGGGVVATARWGTFYTLEPMKLA